MAEVIEKYRFLTVAVVADRIESSKASPISVRLKLMD
jgi:hypothetical protein